jgi:hypothetical protein
MGTLGPRPPLENRNEKTKDEECKDGVSRSKVAKNQSNRTLFPPSQKNAGSSN